VTGKLAAVLIEVTALNLVIFLTGAGSVALIGEKVFWKEIALLHLAFYLLQLEIACVCFGLSACVRRGGLGIGLGLAIGLYFMNLIANLTPSADFLKYITPFGYAECSDILAKGALSGDRLLVGLGFAAAGVALAYWKYCRKDIL
jgi:ABC-2 type transport system permease protein